MSKNLQHVFSTDAITYRSSVLHKVLHPLHEIRSHPAGFDLRYCRTCYILKRARRKGY